jgi:hypothetical protein
MANVPVYERLVDGTWVEVPEDEFIDIVYRHHSRITPIIKIMLAGNTWGDGNHHYRLTIISK